METKILEINLISAQNLKPPSTNLRRMQTYAVVWIDSCTKLRTRIDHVGGENPTWNDKFLFKVSKEFLTGETSAVSFEIFAVGCLRDPLIGTVRFLISNLPLCSSTPTDIRTPSFVALQIRRPSGRFHGMLNVGAVVTGDSELTALNGASALGYRDLMGVSVRRKRPGLKKSKSVSLRKDYPGENSWCDSGYTSDGTESSSTSSSSTASTVLKDFNGIRDLAGTDHVRSSSDGGGMFCGLLTHKVLLPVCLSAHNLRGYCGSQKEN
ncbi:hypothetical protein K2173_025383 [Erythroxylum novogranatense]|uniref:C2 domain-containing protein n=1 Tax=Erythroxylum novogranatense TaxID=1862640 RepID=A0AAV8UDV5_9ROSI|nr:hypothetical protein K2173_025383 [Erythroxylum novogranatense]